MEPGMKILFVHKQILFPRDTGGKIRVLNVLKHLARWHDVTYVANLRRGEERYLPQMTELGLRVDSVLGEPARRGGLRFAAAAAANVLSVRPFSIDRNYDPRVREKVRESLAAEPYDLLICDTVQMARHTTGLGGPPQVLFQHNVEAQILRRHAEVSEGRLRRWYMRGQWRKMVRFERDQGRHFAAVIAVSEPDKKLFEAEYGWPHVRAIDTAVDTDFFRPDPAAEVPDRVMFLGSMDWLPNQDGVKWFVREVWPAVRAARPRATFHVIGRNPPGDIRALSTVPGVEIVGGVPDVRPHLAQATVFVVPILVGGGTRLKIYEGMAMGRAVVSTTIGAEGLPVRPGEHYLAADAPGDFAAAVVGLLADPPRRAAIGRAADRFVRERYGSEPVARQFEAICEGVVDERRAGRVPAGMAD
ncbi:MAG TPA: glycosyltransferase [Fimbriiglobus sp.]|nr:glycosyltransferase [Fimbriiglobus sp.]